MRAKSGAILVVLCDGASDCASSKIELPWFAEDSDMSSNPTPSALQNCSESQRETYSGNTQVAAAEWFDRTYQDRSSRD